MTQPTVLSIVIRNNIENKTTTIYLEPDQTLVFGRMPESGISQLLELEKGSVTAEHLYVLPSEYVSQNHLIIHHTRDGRIKVFDPGSTNGTMVAIPKGRFKDVTRGTVLSIPKAADIQIDYADGTAESLRHIADCKTPAALASLVRRQLADRVESVQVVSDEQQSRALPPRTERFPLWRTGHSLIITWRAVLTRRGSEERWLLDCLALYNARNDSSARPGAPESSWRFVARSPARAKLLEVVKNVAPSSVPILLMGKTGVGKTLLARQIHEHSLVARGPFCRVNIGPIPTTLLEGELFGSEKGSFTNSNERKPGLIVGANGGTLFLDEIDKLPLETQYKLLDVLDQGVIRRIGAPQEIPVRFRLIAASNANLKAMVERMQFSPELYYRIACACFTVPSMADEDVIALVPQLLDELRQEKNGFSMDGLPPCDANEMQLLTSYALKQQCKGGVRELERTLRLYLAFRQRSASIEEAWRNSLHYGPSMEAEAAAEPLPSSTSSDPEVGQGAGGEAWTPHGKDQLRHALHLLGDLMFLQEVRRAVRHPEPGRSMLSIVAPALGLTKTAVTQRFNKKYHWQQNPTQDMLDAELENVRQQLMPYADRLTAAIKLLVPGAVPPWQPPYPPAAELEVPTLVPQQLAPLAIKPVAV